MTLVFSGQVALVTGGGMGIGHATAAVLAAHGARVAVADISVDAANETVGLIKQAGGSAFAVIANMASTADIERMFDETIRNSGRLDIVVNNAGIGGSGQIWGEPDIEDWNRVIAINLTAVWLCINLAIKQMRLQGTGSIVNVASVFGLVGNPNVPAYNSSKHGVLGLTKSAALAVAASGIRVNAVCPGFIDTPMLRKSVQENPEILAPIVALHPIGRLGTSQDIAEAILWLCSPQSAFVVGHALSADGGFSIQ